MTKNIQILFAAVIILTIAATIIITRHVIGANQPSVPANFSISSTAKSQNDSQSASTATLQSSISSATSTASVANGTSKNKYTSKILDKSIQLKNEVDIAGQPNTATLYRLSNPANPDVKSILFTSANTPTELAPQTGWLLESVGVDRFWVPGSCASMPSLFVNNGRYFLTMQQYVRQQLPQTADFEQNFILFDTVTKKFNYFFENQTEKQQIKSDWFFEGEDTVSYYFVPFADIGKNVSDYAFDAPFSLSGNITKRTITISDLSYVDTVEPQAERRFVKENVLQKPYQYDNNVDSQGVFKIINTTNSTQYDNKQDISYEVLKNGVLLTRVLSSYDESINMTHIGSKQLYFTENNTSKAGSGRENIFLVSADSYRRQNLFLGKNLEILPLGFFEK